MSFMELKVESITGVEGYMESYLQVSWASVLSCLFNPMPPFYRRVKAFPLTKFESVFRKTYAAQKLWKVPDPELMKRLRKAITEKIMPGYTKFIEDNNVTTPKFIPQELEGICCKSYSKAEREHHRKQVPVGTFSYDPLCAGFRMKC